jgi:hypothetical protein
MNHWYWPDYYFTPSQEPGMDQCLLNQLRASDIRVIHFNDLGDDSYVETTGFGSGPYYLGDFEPDGKVDLKDFTQFAQQWSNSNCSQCGGKDLNCDKSVDIEDLQFFVQNWLEGL